MTPKRRINAAMNLEPVDRVPFMCQMSIGHMLMQLEVSPLEFWFDKDVFKDGLIKLRQQYEFDGILVSLYGHDPDWREKIMAAEKSDEFESAQLANGDKIFCPYNDLPYYEFANPPKRLSPSEITEENLPQKLDYFPVSQDLPFYIHPEHKFDILEELFVTEGKAYSIHGEITSPFDYYLDFVGHQEGLMGIIDSPDKVKMIMSHFTKGLVNLAEEMCDTGVDAIKISSPFAGAGFISPDDYREIVFPYEKQIVEAIRNKGTHVYIHTCGAVNDRLELMFDTGASGIECLDPSPLGDVELSDAKKRIGSRGFIKGNINSVNLLLNGTKDEIIQDTKKRIEIGSRNNGFILSTACSIAPAVKKENIQLLKKVIDEWT